MADIIAWTALLILIAAVWLLAGRFASNRAEGPSGPDDVRGGVM